MEQRTDEWFAARLGKVTASRVADVLATRKGQESTIRAKYKLQLVTERLTGRKVNSFVNAAMQDGIDREPMAKDIYSLVIDKPINEVGFIDHPSIEMAGASPDGTIGDNGIIEIKCPVETTHTQYLLDKKFPIKYKPQVQFQLACMPYREYCDFVSYNPNFEPEQRLMFVRVERDKDYIEEIEAKIKEFLGEVEDMINQIKGERNGRS